MEDSAGILVTCQHAEAMACFNKGMEAYVSLRENPVPWFQAALKIDSNLVVAHSLLVRYYKSITGIWYLVLESLAGIFFDVQSTSSN